MSESSSLEAEVQHVMSERGTGKGSRGIPVQCCVQRCSKQVRKRLRLHIRKFHKERCPHSCSVCPAKFVGPNDLNNHQGNGCPRLKIIETFLQDVGFSDSSAVNNFITKELQLNDANRNNFRKVVRQLYKYLQDNLPSKFSINKLVKGGSVGKGTAVKDKADIDCVVFLNNVKTVEEHKRKLQETKDCLESCLKQSPYKDIYKTPFAVKFKLDYSSREYHIDLLPTFTTERPEQLYEEIIGCSTEDKAYYSAYFVSLQVEFVKGQPPNVKNLIRLVKYWRKTCIEDGKSTRTTRLPSSYPLELITIACWEEAKKPPSFDIRAGFKAVLKRLVDYCNIHLIWNNYYDEDIAERGSNGMESERPFVLDPANPTNNVCSASNAKGWQTVADVAKMTLERQPLKGIIFNRNWEI